MGLELCRQLKARGETVLAACRSTSSQLNALDIESLEVVKGAAAASLYGSRASSGVIQIRTRRGAGIAAGATRVTARSEVGTNALGNQIESEVFFLRNPRRSILPQKPT